LSDVHWLVLQVFSVVVITVCVDVRVIISGLYALGCVEFKNQPVLAHFGGWVGYFNTTAEQLSVSNFREKVQPLSEWERLRLSF
jgi:hypothetical protein